MLYCSMHNVTGYAVCCIIMELGKTTKFRMYTLQNNGALCTSTLLQCSTLPNEPPIVGIFGQSKRCFQMNLLDFDSLENMMKKSKNIWEKCYPILSTNIHICLLKERLNTCKRWWKGMVKSIYWQISHPQSSEGMFCQWENTVANTIKEVLQTCFLQL
jgi:hypothetical protein